VTLTPKSPFDLSQPEQLQVTAALLTDTFGRELDGQDDGMPGGNFIATFSRRGVQMPQFDAEPALRRLPARAVDAIFARAPSENGDKSH
jgi:hypothetical protein